LSAASETRHNIYNKEGYDIQEKNLIDLKRLAVNIRLETVKQFKARGFGHVGGSLSVADMLAVLYGAAMRYDPKNPSWEDRDYLILSKGHAGPALYSALALKGFFPVDWLATLNQPGTRLPSHSDRKLTPGVDMTTGSLGQGLSVACGVALALKSNGKPNKVYVILGDGECNEGQVWEAALFAAHHKLDKLIVLVDYNSKQLDGTLDEVLELGDLAAKFREFGFSVQTVNGNDVEEVLPAVEHARGESNKPSLIVCKTIKGAGLRSVEETEKNHHLTVDEEFADRSIEELKQCLRGMSL